MIKILSFFDSSFGSSVPAMALKTMKRYDTILSNILTFERDKMKRIYSILIGLVSIILLLISVRLSEAGISSNSEQEFIAEESAAPLKSRFFLSYKESKIYPWEQNGTVYFFLPSYFNWENASLEVQAGQLQINGETIASSKTSISYEPGNAYEYSFIWNGTETKGKLQFLQSANIGAVFIETDSGSMNRVDQDKEYKESGRILITDGKGVPQYDGLLSHVKGRGNATWKSQKKSYGIQLSEPADLFAMGNGRNWILLSNVFDGNKLQNKICLEMAASIGLNYTPESTWVDLYLNGEYWGNYLLCEKIEVGENRVDIEDLEKETEYLNGSLKRFKGFDTGSQKGILATQNPENITGGYIIEGDHYYKGISGFITENGNPFTIRSPQYATWEQVAYVADYIQQIEDLIYSGNNEMYNYIDLDSFVARYILEELVWNYDLGTNSMFFYKYKDNLRLYAGPAWDYDSSLGRYTFMEPDTLVVFNLQNYKTEGNEIAIWYPYLYKNEIFYQTTVETYKNIVRPYVQAMFLPEGKIDQYAETIRQSVAMDMIRWNYIETWTGHYESYENNIRYLKYYLARRLRFLDQEWLKEDSLYEPEHGNGEYHLVTFTSEKGTESFEVPDGTLIQEPPDHLLKEGEWWHNYYNWEDFSSDLPIYEDFTFCAAS